jgi:hypothetical protein
LALLNGEFYLLAFSQTLIASGLDGREVYEYILTAVSGGNKTKASVGIEELHGASRLIRQDSFLHLTVSRLLNCNFSTITGCAAISEFFC